VRRSSLFLIEQQALSLLRRTTRCIRLVCGLAGLTLCDSPGLGLAFSLPEETDQARF
jgi:hypothetical protein